MDEFTVTRTHIVASCCVLGPSPGSRPQPTAPRQSEARQGLLSPLERLSCASRSSLEATRATHACRSLPLLLSGRCPV